MHRIVWLAAILLFPSLSLAAPREYRVKVLPVHPLQVEAAAYSLNESGQVVGYVVFGNPIAPHPFVYDLTTGATTVFSATGHAYDINESGHVTGGMNDRPFVYDGVDVTMLDLSPTGQSQGLGLAINDDGHIAGWVENPDPTEAFLDDGTTVSALGTLGGPRSLAAGINNSGVIVGNSAYSDAPVNPHAFFYENGVMTDIGGPAVTFDYSSALDINESGLIVGEATNGAFVGVAIFANGTVLQYGALSHDRSASALGVNDLGAVVGRSGVATLPAGLTHGLILLDGVLYDLNDYLRTTGDFYVHDAWEINNQGQIAGSIRLPNGQLRAAVLTPVPEPSTLALSALALASLVTLAARRGRAGG